MRFTRFRIALALLLLSASCVTPPTLALGSPMDLDPGDGLTARIEFREEPEAYLLDMELTGSVARNFDVAAELILDNGTTLKGGAPEKTHPDWVDTGTLRRGVKIRFPKRAPLTELKFLDLQLDRWRGTLRIASAE